MPVDNVEARLSRLERTRGMRQIWMPLLCILPMVCLLAGAALDQGRENNKRNEVIADKLVTRSLVLVDDANRPRIDLGIDPEVGAHMFMRGEDGVPMLTLTAAGESGSVAILDSDGHAIAFLTASSNGQGLLRLSDAEGRTIARVGQWAGRAAPGIEFSGQTVEE